MCYLSSIWPIFIVSTCKSIILFIFRYIFLDFLLTMKLWDVMFSSGVTSSSSMWPIFIVSTFKSIILFILCYIFLDFFSNHEVVGCYV